MLRLFAVWRVTFVAPDADVIPEIPSTVPTVSVLPESFWNEMLPLLFFRAKISTLLLAMPRSIAPAASTANAVAVNPTARALPNGAASFENDRVIAEIDFA